MFFEDKKLRYKKLLVIIIPLFVALVICGFFAYRSIAVTFGTVSTTSKKFDIDSMDYHLRSNATDYQIELFDELRATVEDGTNDLAIAESVVKNYIADTYTWDNKKGQWDVGGMCYVYSPMKNNIYFKTKDGFYGLLNKNIDLYGNDGLLEVSNINILESTVSSEKYEVDGNMYDYFFISCEWTYTDDSRFANSVENRMYFNVIKNNDGRFEIVANSEL